MPANVPAASDLYRYLRAAGVVDYPETEAQGLLNLSGKVAAAVNDWERDTHWEPFVVAKDGGGSPVDTTLKFSPQDILYPPNDYPMLDVDGGILSVTSLTVGVTATSAGTVLVQDTDFYLMPSRAPLKGKPYTYIEFCRANFPSFGIVGRYVPNSIVLVGKFGYSLTCPDVAFDAILARAAKKCGPQLSAKFGGMTGWSEADGTKETYGADPFASFLDRADAEYANAVKLFRRVQ